jgi:hypothetical protein
VQLLFSTTSLDVELEKGRYLAKPLLIEIKTVRNVSKPYQRATDVEVEDDDKEQKIGPKKGQMYQLIGHDGVRFLKIVLLFKDLKNLVGKIHEVNKYMLTAGVFVSQGEGSNTFLID